eukprot:COSAG01_NODE_9129_length_2543_cov_2.799100_3_plen_43_part_01
MSVNCYCYHCCVLHALCSVCVCCAVLAVMLLRAARGGGRRARA